MATFLAFKEVWRSRGRFFLFSLVIALITTLVLFIAALAEGLATANREYFSRLDAELLVFQNDVELSANTSQIGRSLLPAIRNVDGVADAGAIGLSSAAVVFPVKEKQVDVSLIGVEPGKPGSPPVFAGRDLRATLANEVVIDEKLARSLDVTAGDTIRIKTIQGTEDKFYNLRIIGVTGSREYLFRPSIFVPYRTWDQIRPQANPSIIKPELIFNIVAVKLKDPQEISGVEERIRAEVRNVDVADVQTAIKAIPGYSAQQSTLSTQQIFTLLIGVLVIGGFFQIQMLQKVPQIGVLKAIGVSNIIVGTAVVLQIVIVTTFGVLMGSLVTLALALGIPGNVPIVFDGTLVTIAVISLLAIGPLGGLVTVRLAISVEPLIALGLSS